MAETYRDQVATLIAQLQEPDGTLGAKEALRGLIDRIVLQPNETDGKLSIHLEGALAALLQLSLGVKRKARRRGGLRVEWSFAKVGCGSRI
ncbi:recombinase [Thalassorhabdomicrobium marinisediminis]|uniref:recombinase n=1 Tax=Thalassorhabdomicrobium marinisediminis TaxID=2170577 RepID=UPI0024913ECD|nr:recombinase [Thalassorhabdomicrobium marinisediminis]